MLSASFKTFFFKKIFLRTESLQVQQNFCQNNLFLALCYFHILFANFKAVNVLKT